MALTRELPYLGCHFQVRWTIVGGLPGESGFSEVVLPALGADAGAKTDTVVGPPVTGASGASGDWPASGPAMGMASTGGGLGALAEANAIARESAIASADAAAPAMAPASNPPLLVLRRGFAGSLDLYAWCNDIWRGVDKRERTLTVDLLDGEHGSVVCTWEFADVRPVRLDYAPLQALGASVLVETLSLSYASVTMK